MDKIGGWGGFSRDHPTPDMRRQEYLGDRYRPALNFAMCANILSFQLRPAPVIEEGSELMRQEYDEAGAFSSSGHLGGRTHRMRELLPSSVRYPVQLHMIQMS